MISAEIYELSDRDPPSPIGGFGLDVLNKLTIQDWVAFFKAGERIAYSHREQILEAGETNDAIHFLADGELSVEGTRDGKVTELARLTSGALFGEMSYLEKSVASANVYADGSAEVVKVDRDAMKRLLDQPDGFGERFYHSLAVTLSRRLRATNPRVC